jgi:hypothetical protein
LFPDATPVEDPASLVWFFRGCFSEELGLWVL